MPPLVLLYHDVADGGASDGFRRYVVPPGLFDEHLSALSSAGYRSASASSLAKVSPYAEEGEAHDLGRAILLTFDDAYASFATAVMPTLARYEMRGCVFVPTAFVGHRAEWLASLGEGTRQIMGWSQLRDVCSAGAEVGAHGHRHLPFDLVSRQELHSELNDPRTILEQRLAQPVTVLAYPYGYHDRKSRAKARQCGYEVGFEVGDNVHRTAAPPPGSDGLLRIRRLVIGPDTSPDQLLLLVRSGRRSDAAQRIRCLARPAWRLLRRLRSTGVTP